MILPPVDFAGLAREEKRRDRCPPQRFSKGSPGHIGISMSTWSGALGVSGSEADVIMSVHVGSGFGLGGIPFAEARTSNVMQPILNDD